MTRPDPMEGGDLMDGAAASGPGPGAVDQGASAESLNLRAREALAQAIRCTASAQERHVLVAALALRFAQLGHAKAVSVKVASGEEAARVVLAVLAEMGARAQDAPGRAGAGPGGAEAVPAPAHALVSVRDACSKRARACLECGRDFEVNPRHARSHRFHSAACRSRYRRRAAQEVPHTDLAAPSRFETASCERRVRARAVGDSGC
jgi:hypothetical protein